MSRLIRSFCDRLRHAPLLVAFLLALTASEAVLAQSGRSRVPRSEPPPTPQAEEFRGADLPLYYPPGTSRYGLAPEGYIIGPDGRYVASNVVNRFVMKIPPIGNRLLVRCDVQAGSFDPTGAAYWDWDDDRDHFGSGTGLTFPVQRGTIEFTIEADGPNGLPQIQSIWLVAGRGTRLEGCSIDTMIAPTGARVRPR